MHHRYLWPAQINSATFVETDGFHTLCFGPMAHQIVLAHNRNIQRPRQAQHIDHMVKMGMGQQNMRGPCRGLGVAVFGHHRVAVQPRIHQQHLALDFVAKRAMAQPNDLHSLSPLVKMRLCQSLARPSTGKRRKSSCHVLAGRGWRR